jgi:hypothetical protein
MGTRSTATAEQWGKSRAASIILQDVSRISYPSVRQNLPAAGPTAEIQYSLGVGMRLVSQDVVDDLRIFAHELFEHDMLVIYLLGLRNGREAYYSGSHIPKRSNSSLSAGSR